VYIVAATKATCLWFRCPTRPYLLAPCVTVCIVVSCLLVPPPPIWVRTTALNVYCFCPALGPPLPNSVSESTIPRLAASQYRRNFRCGQRQYIFVRIIRCSCDLRGRNNRRIIMISDQSSCLRCKDLLYKSRGSRMEDPIKCCLHRYCRSDEKHGTARPCVSLDDFYLRR